MQKGVPMLGQKEKEKIDCILQSHGYNKSQVIAIMQEVQKEYRYLPEEVLSYIAAALKISEGRLPVPAPENKWKRTDKVKEPGTCFSDSRPGFVFEQY